MIADKRFWQNAFIFDHDRLKEFSPVAALHEAFYKAFLCGKTMRLLKLITPLV